MPFMHCSDSATWRPIQTSCRRAAATMCLSPLCKLTISSYLFARWHLFWHVDYLRHQKQVDLWPFDLESGVRVMCDVGYFCANFSLPRHLCSRVTPDVRDRRQTDRCQTDVRQKHRFTKQLSVSVYPAYFSRYHFRLGWVPKGLQNAEL